MSDKDTELRLCLVYPDLAVRWRRVASDMLDLYRMPIRVTEGLRSFSRQWELFSIGRKREKSGVWVITDPKKIVTRSQPSQSLHTYGLAVDSCFLGPDPYLDKLPKEKKQYYWDLFGSLVRTHGLTWGGDWNGNGIKEKNDFDMPHCQITYGLSIHDIQILYEYNGIKSVWAKINGIFKQNGGTV
jgi:hypothetical protein